MPSNHWKVTTTGEPHTIDATWHRWGSSGQILVDGEVIDSWGIALSLKDRQFTVGGKDAILRWSGFSFGKCELYIAGEKVPEAEGG